MEIEKRRTFDPARVDEVPAIDADYSAEVEDRTFDALPSVVRSQVEGDARRRRVAVDTSLGSLVWPDRVKRAGSGDIYRQRLAWAVGYTALVLVDARQCGRLEAGRFRPAGTWRVRTEVVVAPQVKHSQQPSRDGGPARSHDPGAVDPTSLGYHGGYPEVWTALPTLVNGAIQHFVPDAQMSAEYGYAMIEWGSDTIIQRHWYDRRAGQRATAVFMVRSCRIRRRPPSANTAANMIRGEPWVVTAWRADTDTAASGIEITDRSHR